MRDLSSLLLSHWAIDIPQLSQNNAVLLFAIAKQEHHQVMLNQINLIINSYPIENTKEIAEFIYHVIMFTKFKEDGIKKIIKFFGVNNSISYEGLKIILNKFNDHREVNNNVILQMTKAFKFVGNISTAKWISLYWKKLGNN